MGTFRELVEARKSVRHYLPEPVGREKIMACLEAARLAPSAHNVQPWRFLVIDDPGLKERFGKEVFSGIYKATMFAVQAPVLIMILAKPDLLANRVGRILQGIPYYSIDIGIAGEHIALQAREFGLGTCWIGWFNYKKARKFFKIPRSYKVMALMAVGTHESRPAKEKNRLPIEEIAWFNRPGF
jgi:nitroreductase